MKTSWSPKEWQIYRRKLARLTLSELRRIADRVGIKFAGGNHVVRRKDEFLNVLDESYPDELAAEYSKILAFRRKHNKKNK